MYLNGSHLMGNFVLASKFKYSFVSLCTVVWFNEVKTNESLESCLFSTEDFLCILLYCKLALLQI